MVNIRLKYMKQILFPVVCLLLFSCSHSYYLVRHAEKATASSDNTMAASGDVSLSEAGLIRAEKLKDILQDKKIKFIFSTNTQRTLSTARPLSTASGTEIIIYNAKDSTFTDRIKKLKKNTLIVGHSNTTDDVINELAGYIYLPGDIPENEYNNLFVIKYRGKNVSVKRLKY